MKAVLLERLLAVAKKTGDRLVVVEGDTAVVLLPIDRYEELLGGRVQEAQPAAFQEKRPHGEATPSLPSQETVPPVFRGDVRHVPEDLTVLDSIAQEVALEEEQFYLEPVE